jgi:hypothetical protein
LLSMEKASPSPSPVRFAISGCPRIAAFPMGSIGTESGFSVAAVTGTFQGPFNSWCFPRETTAQAANWALPAWQRIPIGRFLLSSWERQASITSTAATALLQADLTAAAERFQKPTDLNVADGMHFFGCSLDRPLLIPEQPHYLTIRPLSAISGAAFCTPKALVEICIARPNTIAWPLRRRTRLRRTVLGFVWNAALALT